MERRTDVR